MTKIEPTQHQIEQEARVLKYVEEQGVASLKGYAGTGKTTMMQWLIPKLEKKYGTVYVAAPTHKAASVLRSKLGNREVRTCASVFGLKPVADGRGGYTFKRNLAEDPLYFDRGSVLITDEASMPGSEYIPYYDELLTKQNVRLLFVGDPAQLPPVHEPSSPFLSFPGGMLTEILRQGAGNPIIDLATAIRTTGSGRIETRVDANGNGVYYSKSMEKWLDSALRQFSSDEYRRSSDHTRILAWRNETVRMINLAVRESLFGEKAPRFLRGEWLVGKEPWRNGTVTVLQNSEEVCVINARETTLMDWNVWRLEVSNKPGDRYPRTIYVLHESETDRYQAELKKLKRQATATRNWRPYFDLKERFAQVDYAYAMTVHKSQGSTFSTVYVMWNDLVLSPDSRERQALVYVAVTRAASRLVVLA